MTENEAIKYLEFHKKGLHDTGYNAECVNFAIQALEEIQQYRAIGTVEEIVDGIKQSEEEFNMLMEYLHIGTIDEVKVLEKQHNNGWIPVEERLPEDGVRVLTCDNYKNVHVMRHYNFYEYPFCIGPEHERFYMPKTWMPLPEPYKESEE